MAASGQRAPRGELREWSPKQAFVKAIDGNDHDYGVNWLFDTIVAAAALYRVDHLATSPNACLITVNDASLPHGAPPHLHTRATKRA